MSEQSLFLWAEQANRCVHQRTNTERHTRSNNEEERDSETREAEGQAGQSGERGRGHGKEKLGTRGRIVGVSDPCTVLVGADEEDADTVCVYVCVCGCLF